MVNRMIKTEQGIIFRSNRYGESSVILDIFSPEQGIKSYIFSGVHLKSGKSKASLVQLLNRIQFVYYEKSQRESLWRIKEMAPAHVYVRLPFDVHRISIGFFLLEICRKAFQQNDENASLFLFLTQYLERLDSEEIELSNFHLYFLIDLSRLLGFGITDNYSSQQNHFNLASGTFQGPEGISSLLMDRDSSKYLHELLSRNRKVICSRELKNRLLNYLVDFYRYHLSDFGKIKSLEVLQSLYS